MYTHAQAVTPFNMNFEPTQRAASAQPILAALDESPDDGVE